MSPGTVSKVLKDYPGISEETRRRVLAVVEEIGFIPNTVASALSTKKNNRIGLYIYINDRFQHIDEIVMSNILGVFDQAREEHLELITIFDGSIENLSNGETLQYFHSIHADTVIVIGINKNNERIHYLARKGGLKMVIVDGILEGDNISTVMIDHFQGQYDAADRICRPGDKVLYLSGKEDGYVTDLRLEGMKKLAQDKHLDLRVEIGGFSEDKAFEIVKGLQEPYDDIVCANDLMAIGARRALPEGSGVRLSGFDGITLMKYVADDVITCKQDFYTIGREAVKAAVRLAAGEKGQNIVLPYSITTIHR